MPATTLSQWGSLNCKIHKICISKTLACPDIKESSKGKKKSVFHSLMVQFYTKILSPLTHGFSRSATPIFCCKCRISKLQAQIRDLITSHNPVFRLHSPPIPLHNSPASAKKWAQVGQEQLNPCKQRLLGTITILVTWTNHKSQHWIKVCGLNSCFPFQYCT